LIIDNANPEVVLSLPDLFDLAIGEEDEKRTAEAVQRFRETGNTNVAALEAYFESEGRDFLVKARVARARLLDVLDSYFHFRHIDDQEAPKEKRSYLRGLLGSLGTGDTVITLNWDTTIERTLAEEGRWNPRLGYGFEKRLEVVGPLGRSTRLPEEFFAQTDIVIL